MFSSTLSFIDSLSKSLCSVMALACCHANAEVPVIQKIQASVFETISTAEEIPGMNSSEYTSLKPGIIQCWNQLVENGSLVVTATDQETRPYFVALQGIVEHVLAKEFNKDVKCSVGIIHTPMPATPLCTKGEVSQYLVDKKIENDPLRLFTVKARTTTVRDYLIQGGKLYIAYPQEGLAKRSEMQQQIYLQELQNYPSCLIDVPLNCAEMDPDIIGATYFFVTRDGEEYVFAIKMTQANSPQDIGQFGLWFGPRAHPAIQERTSKVYRFLSEHGFSQLRF